MALTGTHVVGDPGETADDNLRDGILNALPTTYAPIAATANHIAATAAHGATGAVVGTTNAQTLTSKTIDAAANTLLNVRPRIGASVNLTDSWATAAARTHGGTWSLGEDSVGFVGALTANTTPITIPAGKGGMYAVSLGFSNSAVMTTSGGFIQVSIGGTLLTDSQNYYRVSMPTGASQGSIGITLPLAAGCTLQVISSLTASAYAVTATLSCYRIGD